MERSGDESSITDERWKCVSWTLCGFERVTGFQCNALLQHAASRCKKYTKATTIGLGSGRRSDQTHVRSASDGRTPFKRQVRLSAGTIDQRGRKSTGNSESDRHAATETLICFKSACERLVKGFTPYMYLTIRDHAVLKLCFVDINAS